MGSSYPLYVFLLSTLCSASIIQSTQLPCPTRPLDTCTWLLSFQQRCQHNRACFPRHYVKEMMRQKNAGCIEVALAIQNCTPDRPHATAFISSETRFICRAHNCSAFFFVSSFIACDLCRSWQSTQSPFPRHYGSSCITVVRMYAESVCTICPKC